MEKPVVLIIPSYHNAKVYQLNLDSVFNQKYQNYRVIYIADGDLLSDSDGTGALVERYVKEKKQEHRFTLIRNGDRQLALRNLYRAFLSCRDDEIVAILDGDDALVHPNVLSYVNCMYSNPRREIWYTYGDFKSMSGNMKSWTSQIPGYIVLENRFREWPHMATHLRTCKAWLFKQIKIEDLFFKGNFFRMTYDVALFEPIMEMAGSRFMCSKKVLYNYNDLNVINDHKTDQALQSSLNKYIRQKSRYSLLQKSMSGYVDQLRGQKEFASDLLIFSDNTPLQLQACFDHAKNMLKNINKIYVIYNASSEEIDCQYADLGRHFPDIYFLPYGKNIDVATGFLSDLFTAHSAYITIATDTGMLSQSYDITDCLYWLELTHASAVHLALDKKLFDRIIAGPSSVGVQISLDDINSQTVYAWQYDKKHFDSLNNWFDFVVLRKKELELTGLFLMLNANYADCFSQFCKVFKKQLADGKVGLFYHGDQAVESKKECV